VAGLDIDELERVGSREPPFAETAIDDSGAPIASLAAVPLLPHPATCVSSNTRPYFAAASTSPRRKASLTASSFRASSTER
jgi:hypothetical protein